MCIIYRDRGVRIAVCSHEAMWYAVKMWTFDLEWEMIVFYFWQETVRATRRESVARLATERDENYVQSRFDVALLPKKIISANLLQENPWMHLFTA